MGKPNEEPITDADRKAAMALLDPGELAAMNDTASEEEIAALKAVAGQSAAGTSIIESDDDGDDGDDDGDDGDGQGGAAAPAASAAKPAAKPGGEPAAGAAPDATASAAASDAANAETDAFRTRYSVELPADFDDQVAAVAASEATLLEKFKGGEIDADEFVAKQRELQDKKADLRVLKDRAETFEMMNEQQAKQEWAFAVDKFMARAKTVEGIDYRGNKAMEADFDAFVKTLAGREENANKDFAWFLAEAHKRTKALYGVADPAPQKKADATAEGSRKPPEGLPKSLAGIPGGDGPGDLGGDEFADLDKLTGEAYELALARLSPAQREKYLATA